MNFSKIEIASASDLLNQKNFKYTIFLSEFPEEHWIRTESWGVAFALRTFAIATLILLIGHFCKANALFVEIFPVLNPTSEILNPSIMWRGYLAELNHGFCYLFVAPLCFILLYEFLKRADIAFFTLLKSKNIGIEVLESIASKNKRIFAPFGFQLVFVLIATMVVWNTFNELWWNQDIAKESPDSTVCIGYSQRPFFNNWNCDYQQAVGSDRYAKLSNMQIAKQLECTIYERVLSPQSRAAKLWAEKGAVKLHHETVNKDDVMYHIGMKDPLELDIPRAADKQLVTFQMQCNAVSLNDRQKKLHQLFLLVIVILEGTVHGFGLWLLFKCCFWFYQIQHILPKDLNCDCKTYKALKITFDDPANSYGLRPLHSVYNVSAYLTLCIAFIFTAQYLNESGNGLISLAKYSWQTASAVLLGLSSFIALLAIALSIIASTAKIKLLEKEKQTQMYQKVSLGTSIEETRNALKQMEDQYSWPSNDKRFLSSVSLALSLILIPVVINTFGNLDTAWSSELRGANVMHNQIKSSVDSLCTFYCKTFCDNRIGSE